MGMYLFDNEELEDNMRYEITKEFKKSSFLYGLCITEITSVYFWPGFETEDYIITTVKEL